MTLETGGTRRWPGVGRAVLMLLGALVAAQAASIAFAAFGYMSGSEGGGGDVDWGTQPLELIAQPDACALNVEGVAPGRHEVDPIAEGSAAEVVIKDPQGKVVFSARAEPDGVIHPSAVLLRELGSYRVECRRGGEVTSTTLRVTSADDLPLE